MTTDPSPRKIALFGHCGTKNLGDEALLAAAIQNVRSRAPEAKIIGFTINPDDTRERHKIPAFPIRRLTKTSPSAQSSSEVEDSADPSTAAKPSFVTFLKSIPGLRASVAALRKFGRLSVSIAAEPKFLFDSYRRLRGSELLLILGSQQLNDFNGGAWGFPYSLYKWSILAKLTGAKVAFLSVGAGPLTSRLGKNLAGRALRMASYHSYRGDSSLPIIRELNVPGENFVAPDLVYSLALPDISSRKQRTGLPIVGINPVPYFDWRYWPESDPKIYQEYIHTLADMVIWVAERGYQVVIFPTQLRADPPVVTDIESIVKAKASPELLSRISARIITDLNDLILAIDSMDFIVASRFHGIVIPLVLRKPVLAVAYHGKTRDVMVQMGQGEYALDIHPLALKDLQRLFAALETNREAVIQETARHAAAARAELDRQYDKVFRLTRNAGMMERKKELLDARS